jgi:tight adherence protein C
VLTPTMLLTAGFAGVFVALFTALVALGGVGNEARGVSRSLAVVEAFGAAPKPLQDELDPGFKDRVLRPLVDRFVGLGKRVTPADYAERARQQLERAGNPEGWTTDRVTALKVVGLGSLLAISFGLTMVLGVGLAPSLVFMTIGAVVGYFAPNIYLWKVASDRAMSMRRAFPDAIDLLTISVEAGLGFDAALAHVAKNIEPPLSEEFSRVLQEMQIGLGRGGALRALGERTTLEEMRGFVSAMVQADAFGIPVGKILRVQSAEIRVKRRQRAEEKAQKLPVKILFPLIFFILPCLFMVIMGPAAISMRDLFAQM